MTSYREEALLSAACLQIQTATFPWVSSLPNYSEEFTLDSFHNYVSQFCKIKLSLLGYFSFVAYGSYQARHQIRPSIATYITAVATGSLTQCRDTTNLIMPQQERHKSPSFTHTHTHTHTQTHTHTHTLLIILL